MQNHTKLRKIVRNIAKYQAERIEDRKMTEKQLKRLGRAELVDIIYELQKQNQQKEQECQALRDTLQKRELILSRAGSIAEAALQINGVMEAAQAAADQYLLSVRALGAQMASIPAEQTADAAEKDA